MDIIAIGSDVLMSDGGLQTSVSGDIELIGGDANLIQAVTNNLRTIYGELESDPFAGNMAYLRRVKLTDSGMKVVEADCRNAILYDQRVKEVSSISVERLADMTCLVTFAVKKYDDTVVDGTTIVNLGEV